MTSFGVGAQSQKLGLEKSALESVEEETLRLVDINGMGAIPQNIVL